MRAEFPWCDQICNHSRTVRPLTINHHLSSSQVESLQGKAVPARCQFLPLTGMVSRGCHTSLRPAMCLYCLQLHVPRRFKNVFPLDLYLSPLSKQIGKFETIHDIYIGLAKEILCIGNNLLGIVWYGMICYDSTVSGGPVGSNKTYVTWLFRQQCCSPVTVNK